MVVKHPFRSRSFGFGYSTQRAGEGSHLILAPAAPEYRGTLGQIQAELEQDRQYVQLRDNAQPYRARWFYCAMPILWTGSEMPFASWLEEAEYRRFCELPVDSVTLVLEVKDA
jgi:hypothetical protein